MNEVRRNILVGGFVLTGLVALAVLVVLFGQAQTFMQGRGTYTLNIRLKDAGGIRAGNLVIVRGIEIGRVVSIDLVDPADLEAGVNVKTAIGQQYPLPQGSTAEATEPVFGQGRPPIEILPGPAGQPRLASGAVIDGRVKSAIDSIFPPGIVSTFDKTATEIGTAAAALTPVLHELREVLQRRSPQDVDRPGGPQGNLASAITRLDTSLKHFNDVLGDPTVKSQIKDAVANFERISVDGREMVADLKVASADVKQMAADGRTLVTRAGATLAKIDGHVDDVARQTIEGLHSATRILDDLNVASHKIAAGEGNVGRFIMDDKLYESLVFTFQKLGAGIDEFRALLVEWRKGKIRVALQPPAPTVAHPQLVVGTAGHIDHGKSRLVWALTGTNPDRLPEEQTRGMTIELGFAYRRVDDCDLWFVDVPGHERFIRTMVSGATGIDVALLVVAADDSVMPQTREHAEVLALLGVRRCVIALTKLDLVDDEWADAVEAEARGLLAEMDLDPIACVRTSAENGRGLDELAALLARLARESPGANDAPRWFRLPIDRAFSIAGRGTVVTGSVAHGAVARDDTLDLWPSGRRVRVRDLQSHNAARESADGRMRLAVNLAGVALHDVQRGHELAAPGYLTPTRVMEAWIASLRFPGARRRAAYRLRLHIATSDVLAELRFAEAQSGDAVRGAFAQIKSAEPVVAAWGQPFILRDEAATRTLGGGRILRAVARTWTTRNPPASAQLAALRDAGPVERAAAVLAGATLSSVSAEHLAAQAGLPDAAAAEAVRDELLRGGQVAVLEAGGAPAFIHCESLEGAARALVARLESHLKRNPRSPGVAAGEWPTWMPRACPERLRPALAEWLIRAGRVQLRDGFVAPLGRQDAMSADDAALLAKVLDEFHAGAFQPPALDALRCRTPRNEKRIRELVKLAVARRQLVPIADGVWLHAARWDELVRTVRAAIELHGPLTVGQIRDLIGSSRKFVVPIAEALDAAGVTKRMADVRVLGPAGGAKE